MDDYKSKIKDIFEGRIVTGDFGLKTGLRFYSGDKKFQIPSEDCPSILKKYVTLLYSDVLSAKEDLDIASIAMHHDPKNPTLSFNSYFTAFEKRKNVEKKLSNAKRYIRNKFGLRDRMIHFNFIDTGYTLDYVLMHNKDRIMENIGTFFKE